MAYFGTKQHQDRLARIEVKRRAISKGAIYSVNHDGLIIARKRRRGMRYPVRGMFVAVVSVLVFKVGLMASIGAATYGQRVDELSAGSVVERAGAWVMQSDPMTYWAAMQVKLFLT